MDIPYDIHIISGTHWDREWQFPFEKTRMLLVDAMDELLDMLDEPPDGVRYHLDGQTIPVVDYLEVRPENRERLRRHVRENRLLIGPWLVLPEENQMSGESLIRNLLWGKRHGREFGGRMTVGYSPTSWGQVSQMPQIFREAGVESIIFYRGLDIENVPGHYYFWEGPDGSRLFGLRLGALSRYGFHLSFIRPVLFVRHPIDFLNDTAATEKPLRICGGGSGSLYEFCRPEMGWHPERLEEAFQGLVENDLGEWETEAVPAFACDDSTGPMPAVDRIVREADRLVTNDRTVRHDTLPGFMSAARSELNEESLPTLTGEMRHPGRGEGRRLYAEIQATRIPTKYANRRTECMLQRVAEPLSTIAWMLGEEYPRFQLDRANFTLLSCHAHDSIGGCGHDRVDEEVRGRFRRVQSLAETLTERAVRTIGRRVDARHCDAGDILLLVVNPSARPRSAVVEGEVDFERDREIDSFIVEDMEGARAQHQVISSRDAVATFCHPAETPRAMESRRWRFHFFADDVPAMGYRVFRVRPDDRLPVCHDSMLTGPVTMENDTLRARINGNGTVDVTVKAPGWTLRGQNAFEDRGETGDYWLGGRPDRDRVVSSRGQSADIAVVEDGPLCVAIEARIRLNVPIGATADGSARRSEIRPLDITTLYRLFKGERFLRITTTIKNRVEDHLLRAMFPTGVPTDAVHAEVPFDVVQRPIPEPDDSEWNEPYRSVQPHRRFVDLSDGERGVAILNRGLPQYAAINDSERTLALTLLRCHPAWNSVREFYYEDQDGTQLQGNHTFEYALMPHEENWHRAGLPEAAERFNTSPIVAAFGPGEGDLPLTTSFLELEGDGVVLHAVKQGEWDESVIVRLSNVTDTSTVARLTVQLPFGGAEVLDAMEEKARTKLDVDGDVIEVPMGPKKIVTVKLGNET